MQRLTEKSDRVLEERFEFGLNLAGICFGFGLDLAGVSLRLGFGWNHVFSALNSGRVLIPTRALQAGISSVTSFGHSGGRWPVYLGGGSSGPKW